MNLAEKKEKRRIYNAAYYKAHRKLTGRYPKRTSRIRTVQDCKAMLEKCDNILTSKADND